VISRLKKHSLRFFLFFFSPFSFFFGEAHVTDEMKARDLKTKKAQDKISPPPFFLVGFMARMNEVCDVET